MKPKTTSHMTGTEKVANIFPDKASHILSDLPAVHPVRGGVVDLVPDPPVGGAGADGAARHALPRAGQRLQQRALDGALHQLQPAQRHRHVPRRLHLHGLLRTPRVRNRPPLNQRKEFVMHF